MSFESVKSRAGTIVFQAQKRTDFINKEIDKKEELRPSRVPCLKVTENKTGTCWSF